MRNVDLSDDLLQLAEAQVTAGRAASIEDVVRAGVDALELRDQARYDRAMIDLQTAIDEGDASGVFKGDPFEQVRTKFGFTAKLR